MPISYDPLRPTLNDNDPDTPVDAAWGQDVQDAVQAIYDLANAAGELIYATAADTLERLAAGTSTQVLHGGSTPSWSQIVNADAAFTFSTYTPELTASSSNPTLGTGSTQSGSYAQIGDLVFGRAVIVFGTSGENPGSGFYSVSLPVASAAQVPVGGGYVRDSSVGTHATVALVRSASTTVNMRHDSATFVGAASPWTWAASDSINLFFQYEAA